MFQEKKKKKSFCSKTKFLLEIIENNTKVQDLQQISEVFISNRPLFGLTNWFLLQESLIQKLQNLYKIWTVPEYNFTQHVKIELLPYFFLNKTNKEILIPTKTYISSRFIIYFKTRREGKMKITQNHINNVTLETADGAIQACFPEI